MRTVLGLIFCILLAVPVTAAAEQHGTSHESSASQHAWQIGGSDSVLSKPVTFQNAGATLRGTLYWPKADKPVPALVVFHSASAGNGDAALYRHLREALPALGIAVLLFNRRGIPPSTGSRNVSYETFADDGIAGARVVAKLPQIDPSRIGYWGLSQGGWFAVLAAKRDPRAAFSVAVSAPLTSPETQMEFAMSNLLELKGYPSSDVAVMLAARKALAGFLRGTAPRTAAVAALEAIEHKPWFGLMFLPSASQLPAEGSITRSNGHLDKDFFAAVESVRIPMLLIFGGADPWIPVNATVQRLKLLLPKHPNLTYEIVPKAGHEMMQVQNETMALDPTDAPQAPVYFMVLASWLTKHALALDRR